MSKGIPKKTVAAVLARDRGLCVIKLNGCQIVASCADHRRSRGNGGARSLDGCSNLIAACGLCNGAKEDATGAVREALIKRGVTVEAGRTHAHEAEKARTTPVQYPDGGWWLLDDDGGKEEHRAPDG